MGYELMHGYVNNVNIEVVDFRISIYENIFSPGQINATVRILADKP